MRLTTWLAPSIPLAFYQRVGAALQEALSRPVEVTARYDCSGPTPSSHNPTSENPFATGETDLGFVCAPSYLALAQSEQPSVTLLGAAPVFDDPRAGDRPLYFCDVVVREDDPARSVEDLRGYRFGYNDLVSLSGWWGMAHLLGERGSTPSEFFGECVQSGAHPASLDALRRGEIDVASIDSTLLTLAERGCHPSIQPGGYRLLHSIGPWPVQPCVVRADLPNALVEALRGVLLDLGPWPDMALHRFAEQSHDDVAVAAVATRPPPVLREPGSG